MATPDLREIALDGFALIDKYYGPPRRANNIGGFAAPARQGRNWVVQASNSQMEEGTVISSNEAAAHYGGVMFVNYPKGKPQNRWGRSIKP